MITHVNFTILYVTDQEQALRFFVDTLGFTAHTDAEMAPGKRWLEVALPGERTNVVLANAADFGITPDLEHGPAFTLACDDVTATCGALRAKGAQVTEPVIEPWGSHLTVEGPDGYQILVAQTK